MQVDLMGKVALVTGAARGIGKAIADALAENGATVVYSDLDTDALSELPLRQNCRNVGLDITDRAQIEETIDGIAAREGRLDILVNNAGVNTLRHRVALEDFPPEEWDRIIAVDLTGVYSMSRHASRLMLTHGGRIINVSSVLGLVPAKLQCAFVAAKAGVINLTRAMALEFGNRGILVNSVAPGSIVTDATRALFYDSNSQFSKSVKELLDHIPLGRPGRPEEVANAALFLAAPESSYINGHVLTVDGGWTAGYLRPF